MTAQCLGIVLPDANCLHFGFYNRAMSSFRAIATRHDHDCKVFTEEDIARRTDSKRSGGPGIFGCKGLIIFCPRGDHRVYLRPLLQQGVALALIRRKGTRTRGFLQIGDDARASMRKLLDYMHEQCGSRRIAFLGTPYRHGSEQQDFDLAYQVFAQERPRLPRHHIRAHHDADPHRGHDRAGL